MTLSREDLVFCSASLWNTPFLVKAEAAASAGFRGISILTSDYTRARDAGVSDRDIVTRLADLNLEVAEVSHVGRWTLGDTRAVQEEELVFRLTELLEADGFNASVLDVPMGDVEHAADAFGALCDRAAAHGTRCQIEFYPWCEMRDLNTTWEVVRRAGRPNGGVMFDTWHHFRSGGTPADLTAVPADRIFGVQLADAPARPDPSGLRVETRERLPLGDGDIPLVETVRTLDRLGVDVGIGIEIINTAIAERPASEVAELMFEGGRWVLGQARGNSSALDHL